MSYKYFWPCPFCGSKVKKLAKHISKHHAEKRSKIIYHPHTLYIIDREQGKFVKLEPLLEMDSVSKVTVVRA